MAEGIVSEAGMLSRSASAFWMLAGIVLMTRNFVDTAGMCEAQSSGRRSATRQSASAAALGMCAAKT